MLQLPQRRARAAKVAMAMLSALLTTGAVRRSGCSDAVSRAECAPTRRVPPSPPRWRTLPRPAALPAPAQEGRVQHDGASLWFATFGEGAPVVLLHGGLGHAGHFGDLVRALAPHYRVIVMDSRGQGRSTRSPSGISYQRMADDVVALLDHLAIARAAVVGWSDGGAIGLDLAIRHPERLTRLFVLASNYDLGGVRSPGAARTFRDYFARCRAEYAKLAPDPSQLPVVIKELRAMWRSQPTFSAEQLAAVRVPTTIALGEHDEIIRRDHAEQLARLLPEARFVLLPDVSHFALWQAPAQLAAQVLEFLAAAPSSTKRQEPSAPTSPSAQTPRGARELPAVPDGAERAPTHR